MLRSLFSTLALATLSIAFGQSALADILPLIGADSSGGGKVVACRNSDGSLRSVELLDLFEARALYGLGASSKLDSIDDYFAVVEAKLRDIYKGARFTVSPFYLVEEARSRMRLLPQGTELVNLDDAQEIALPIGCKTEQLAVYRENALLLINSDLWSALDARNQAALFVHEAIYQIDRYSEAENSIYARKVTGHLFSDFHFEPLMKDVPKNAPQCVINSKRDPNRLVPYYNFYIYQTPGKQQELTLQFTNIGGKLPFAKTYTIVPVINAEEGASMYAKLQSGFETHSGVSLSWRSWEELKRGKFIAIIPGEGVLNVECTGPAPQIN